jgi:protein SCO1/2
MHRRSYLGRLGATVGAASLAGCVGDLTGGGGGNPNVALSPPDKQGDPQDFAYPGYGQRVPDVTLTDPIAETDVDVRAVGTPYLMTFIFTYCRDVCPLLTQSLKRVQDDAAENGYGDAVTFLDLTFDPARDDAERFREYADERGVDLAAGNWHFLRAGGPERTRAVVAENHPEGFGVPYRRSDAGTATATTTAGETTATDDGEYMFSHLSLVLLANADGYVERAYPGPNPPTERIVDDLSRVR